MRRTVKAADLFCGAGGTSSGLARACERLGYQLDLVAVNHWDVAIATHTENHPGAAHLCSNLDAVDPRRAVPGGKLDLLLASPECTHFSAARGGKPVTDQRRSSAWLILRWAELLYIKTLIVENVKEFLTWGPVGSDGFPMKSRKGETFRAWKVALESLGYRVDYRILNAADYGAATTRERLFVQAVRGNRSVSWPAQTHSRTGKETLFSKQNKWRAAREIIDWSKPGKSIFARKRPLSPATMARIVSGLEKFGGPDMEPFLVILRGQSKTRSVDSPIPTVGTSGANAGFAQPFLTQYHGNHEGREDGAQRNYSVKEPIRSLDTSNRFGIVEPRPFVLGHRQFQSECVDSIDRPLRTITAVGASDMAVVEPKPFIVPQFSEHPPRSVDRPIGAITTTSRGVGLASPFLLQLTHGGRVYDVDNPVPTVTTAHRGETGVVSPFLAKYYGSGDGAVPVTDPVPTVTTKDRFGLVTPLVIEQLDGTRLGLDILFRMLNPAELAAAMGFPAGYRFTGNRGDIVKQIGNAVVVDQAQALCEAVLS